MRWRRGWRGADWAGVAWSGDEVIEMVARDPIISASALPAELREEAAGLTEAEAERRRAQFGENALAESHDGLLKRFLSYFWGRFPG